jgi:HD-like signal output (HDOD) protein
MPWGSRQRAWKFPSSGVRSLARERPIPPRMRPSGSVRPHAPQVRPFPTDNPVMSVEAISQDRLLQIANSFPATRHTLLQLGSLLRNPAVCLERIVVPLRRDPALVARLIRSANSVVYAQTEPVASVEDAVSLMGYQEVHRMVGFALLDHFSDGGLPSYGISSKQLRENSLFTALLMEELAPGAGEDPRNSYTIGLLRSIGKVALDKLGGSSQVQIGEVPERIEEAGIAEWERSTYGITNTEAAGAILKAWRFPNEIVVAISDHYAPDGRLMPLTNLLHLAAGMAHMLGHGLPGESGYWTDSEEIYQRCGLEPASANLIIDHALSSFDRLIQAAP